MMGASAPLAQRRLTLSVGFRRLVVGTPEHRGLGGNDWRSEVPALNLNTGQQADVNSLAMLLRRRDPVGSLRAATGGDPAQSQRWRDVYSRYGVGDELRAAAVDRYGCWGEVFMFRSSDDRPFDEDDARLMSAASSIIARTLRAGQVAPMRGGDPAPIEVGVLLLDEHLRLTGFTPATRAWCEALNPNRVAFADGIPSALWNVVGRLLGAEDGVCPHLPPCVRMRARDGSWGVVEAARLEGDGNKIVVTMRQATSLEVLGLVSRAHALSPRECEVLALLLAGSQRNQTAERLSISRHTVEAHTKSILEKVGVRSRRELVSGIFGQTTHAAGASSDSLRSGVAVSAAARAERIRRDRADLDDRDDEMRPWLPNQRGAFARHLGGLLESSGRTSAAPTGWTDGSDD
jgi:DNA-binding CsgD family transcriptional regulator